MTSPGRCPLLLWAARIWAGPLWWAVRRSEARSKVVADIDWWIQCIDSTRLSELDRYTRFAYLSGALREFRTVVHYRLRPVNPVLRLVLRTIYRPAVTLTLDAGAIGPGFFVQHGVGTIVSAESIGSYCWVNQQVTIGFDARGRPTLGDRVRVGAGAVVLGPITLHDGATVGANATVVHTIPAGVTVVAPLAQPLLRPPRRLADDDWTTTTD